MPVNTDPDIHEQVICANCFIRKGDEYLVLRRSDLKKWAPGVMHPVGGKVDLGENPYTAAIREVQEEAGVTLTNVHLKAVLTEIQPVMGEPYNWQIFYFIGDWAGGEIKQTEEGELLWLSRDAFLKEKLFPSLQAVGHYILNDDHGVVFATLQYDDQKQHITKQTIDYCMA